MLGLHQRRQHPRHRRELARRHIRLERLRERRPEGVRVQLRVLVVRLEVLQVVVAEVGVRAAVDLPRDAPRLELLGHRRPGELADLLVVQRLELRSAVASVGIDRGADRVQPVRVGGPDERAVVAVAQRERVGQRVVVGDVLALVIAHGQRKVCIFPGAGALRIQPAIMSPFVPGIHLALARVRQRPHPRHARVLYVQPPRSIRGARAIRLNEHRVAIRQPQRTRVVEAADPLQRPQRMVERAILLHQNHNVFGIRPGRPRLGSNRMRPANGIRKKASRPGSSGEHSSQLQEIASCRHRFLSSLPLPSHNPVVKRIHYIPGAHAHVKRDNRAP